MTALAIVCAALVGIIAIHYAHRRRPAAERMVDLLYNIAAAMYSLAYASDMALCAYRSKRQEIRESHIPMYVEAN